MSSLNKLFVVTLELDENAEIISYEEYYPFGSTSYRTGRNETEVSQKRYKYVMKELDNETGLYYYGMRYYASWLARFISVDPLQHEYPYYTPFQYAGNKPITFIDLDGAEPDESAITKKLYISVGYHSPAHFSDSRLFRDAAKYVQQERGEKNGFDGIQKIQIVYSGRQTVNYINSFDDNSISELNIWHHGATYKDRFCIAFKHVGVYEEGETKYNIIEDYVNVNLYANEKIQDIDIMAQPYSSASIYPNTFFMSLFIYPEVREFLNEEGIVPPELYSQMASANLDDIHYGKFTNDAICELNGCGLGVEGFAGYMSKKLYLAGKENAVVIGHVGKTNAKSIPTDGGAYSDFRYGSTRAIFWNGIEIYRGNYEGDFSRDFIDERIEQAKTNIN